MARPELLPEDASLSDAKEWLQDQINSGNGVECPCCGQYAWIYRRKLNANMAASLIKAYRAVGVNQWFHAPTILGRNDGEFAKLYYWGIIEEERRLRPDGGRAGWWRITVMGSLFARNLATAPAHVLIYNGQLLKHDATNGRITIEDVLGDKFSYRELMGEKVEV